MKFIWIIGFMLLLWLVLAQNCLMMRQSDEKATKEFSRSGVALQASTITVHGKHLHFVKTGNDSLPTLIFVHGSPGNWDAFERYLKDRDLLKKFRMVSIDRPGFGYSEFGDAQHLAQQSSWISPLFTVINNHRPVFIAGHSLGGPMVIKLTADNPGTFAAIVIISGSIDPAEEKPEQWRPWLYKTPLNYFVPGALRPANEELWYLKSDLIDLKIDFAKIRCPVHFIHGKTDTWVPPGNVTYGKKMLVNAPFITETLIDSANHFIPWTRFNQIKDVLLKLY